MRKIEESVNLASTEIPVSAGKHAELAKAFHEFLISGCAHSLVLELEEKILNVLLEFRPRYPKDFLALEAMKRLDNSRKAAEVAFKDEFGDEFLRLGTQEFYRLASVFDERRKNRQPFIPVGLDDVVKIPMQIFRDIHFKQTGMQLNEGPSLLPHARIFSGGAPGLGGSKSSKRKH